MQAHPAPARLHTYHSSKKQLVGAQTHAPPAWRTAPGATKKAGAGPAAAAAKGSKILLSQLPTDVAENEVEMLFTRTVGPVRDVFLVYNSQGRSKGMAIITFARPEDAAQAREMYNGKIIDDRRPIKIEIIKDGDDAPPAAPAVPQKPRTLLDRIAQTPQSTPKTKTPVAQRAPTKTQSQPKAAKAAAKAPAPKAVFATNPKARLRTKKGPKRIQKQQKKVVTAEELDQEMEDYRATADAA